MHKKVTRLRRAKRARMKIRELNATRLCVHRTSQHIYAQLIEIDSMGDRVVASASTLDTEVKSGGGICGNIKSATVVGKILAERAIKNGIKAVAFDRSGFKYHGCIKAVADAARDAGLQF